jgi:hypothetical protein
MPFDLVGAAKLAGTALKFVEGGPLAEALAALNLQAAISALNKTKTRKISARRYGPPSTISRVLLRPWSRNCAAAAETFSTLCARSTTT